MRREYRKPYLLMESFQLDAAIATSCSDSNKQTMGHSLDTCDFLDETSNLVTQFGQDCRDTIPEISQDYNSYCYHEYLNPYDFFLAS